MFCLFHYNLVCHDDDSCNVFQYVGYIFACHMQLAIDVADNDTICEYEVFTAGTSIIVYQ